jgi:hypothetical protein
VLSAIVRRTTIGKGYERRRDEDTGYDKAIKTGARVLY